jgi:hypothetical protein
MPPEVATLFNQIWAIINPFVIPAWNFIKEWYWVVLPFVLIKPFKFLWLWWRIETWLNTVYKPILLEIKIPKDSLKPIRAMENVMASLHAVTYQPPDWWEKWIDGQVQTTLWAEIVSIGGDIHFFVRFHSDYRQAVEASIYAQFPEAEINQAQDYTKNVPMDIPNKDWDLFGSDYKTAVDDHYPIRTYTSFETETESEEEKRVDPVASLLEAMAKIKPGEQIWFQFGFEPMGSDLTSTQSWLKKGQVLRNILAKRPDQKVEMKPMAQEMAEILITGKQSTIKEVKEEMFPPEMRLTPGEKDIITAVELKMSKPLFNSQIRFIYLGKTDVWFKSNFRLAFSFFSQFTTNHLNALYPNAKTLTKIHKHWFIPINSIVRPRRAYLRRRKIFRLYTNRLSPFYPRGGGTFVLNTEEAASMFHFPSWVVAPVPGVPRVEAKKGAPPNLPVE